jgi:hypothetical protein
MIARLLAVSLLVAVAARAAEVTDVATAGDEKRPFEIDLAASYTHLRQTTTIGREVTTAKGIVLQDELTHVRTLDATTLRLAVGLWHDLELHGWVNLALHDEQTWNYARGATAASSSLTNNTINISGCANPALCTAAQPIVAVPGQSEHTGLYDPTIGIAWKPISESRELKVSDDLFIPGFPVASWVIGFDYTLPVGGRLDDPSRFVSGRAAGATGESRKTSVLSLWTAYSKRYRRFEPYVRFEGDYSFASNDAYDNCSRPGLLSAVAAANCAGSFKGQTGYQPPVEAAASAGTELIAFEDRPRDRKVAVDLRGNLRWHGPQRGYSQMTDALGKLTHSDEYLTAAGQLGVYGRIARSFHARLFGTLGTDTGHFITTEDFGAGPRAGAPSSPGQNPSFDFRTDQVGRRLKAEPASFWGLTFTASADF